MSENVESEYYKDALEEYKDMMDDEEKDKWDMRINDTGCYVENLALQLCHTSTNDWRQCVAEMEAFRKCWQKMGNLKRVTTIDKKGLPKSGSKYTTTQWTETANSGPDSN